MGLKEKTVGSIRWNTIATVVTMVIGILQIAILTRLLEKSDFGIIAIASMVIAFTDIFAELGITAALIHKQDISRNEYSSVYWLNLGMSIVICGITVLCAPFVAKFYKEPALTLVVQLLSLKIVLTAFGKMFQTIKTKNLEFDFISKVRILAAFVGIVTSTLLAYLGFGVMSLVFGQLLQVLTNQGIYAIAGMRKMRLRFHFSFSEVKDVLKIGGYQIGTQILDFIAARVDVLLIGRFFSMDQLGVYNIAKELVIKPYTIINSITSNVFSAAFAKIQNSIESVANSFSKLNKTVAIVSAPIYVCMFVFSDLIVSILYSPAFSEVSVYIRLLALMGICSAISSQGAPLMIAKGRTDLGLQWTFVRIIISVTVLVLTARVSLYAVAYGQSGLALISIFIYFFIVLRPLLRNITITQYLTMFGFICLGSIILACPFVAFNMAFKIPVFIQIIMFGVYMLMVYVFLRKYYRNDLYEILRLVPFTSHSRYSDD